MDVMGDRMDNLSSYEKAKKRIKRIRGFYGHVSIFIVINVLVLVMRFYFLPKWGIVSDDEGFNNWLNINTFIFPGLWGIGLAIDGLRSYGVRFFSKWEDRKIKEYMDKEDVNIRKWE